MKASTIFASIVLAVSSASADYTASAPMSTMTVHPGCPSAPPADVIVTRSAVPVPSCEAGSNSTKPTVISMSGSGASSMGGAGGMGGSGNTNMTKTMSMGTGTPTAGMPEFTGAASRGSVVGLMGLAVGVVAALMV